MHIGAIYIFFKKDPIVRCCSAGVELVQLARSNLLYENNHRINYFLKIHDLLNLSAAVIYLGVVFCIGENSSYTNHIKSHLKKINAIHVVVSLVAIALKFPD